MARSPTIPELMLRLANSTSESENLLRRIAERMDAGEKERALRHAQLMSSCDAMLLAMDNAIACLKGDLR